MATINQHPAFGPQGGAKGLRDVPTVESSFIENFRYDPSTFQLTVTMKNGAQYLHFYVYPMTMDQLMASPSKGKFYNEVIKGKSPGVAVTHKEIGPQVRNPLKGPKHEQRKKPVPYRT